MKKKTLQANDRSQTVCEFILNLEAITDRNSFYFNNNIFKSNRVQVYLNLEANFIFKSVL